MKQEIIDMARQANATQIGHKPIAFHFFIAELEAFAKLVDDKATAREREAWSKVCEDIRKVFNEKADLAYVAGQKAEREACADMVFRYISQTDNMEARGCLASVAHDIRARGQA